MIHDGTSTRLPEGQLAFVRTSVVIRRAVREVKGQRSHLG